MTILVTYFQTSKFVDTKLDMIISQGMKPSLVLRFRLTIIFVVIKVSRALNLVQESSVDKLFQEEFDVTEFRVLDTETLQHAEVPVFYGQKHGAQMLQVCSHQMKRRAEVLDGLRF